MGWFILGIVTYHFVAKIVVPTLRMSQKYRTILEEEKDEEVKKPTS